MQPRSEGNESHEIHRTKVVRAEIKVLDAAAGRVQAIVVGSHKGLGVAGLATPGTFVLAMFLMLLFVVYYYINYAYLASLWKLG